MTKPQAPLEPTFSDMLRTDVNRRAARRRLSSTLLYCQEHSTIDWPVGNGKGDRRLLCEAPFGPFRQKVPVTFYRLFPCIRPKEAGMDWRSATAMVAVVLAAVGLSAVVDGGEPGGAREAASREGIVADWMLQDYVSVRLPRKLERRKEAWREKHLTAPESKPDAPVPEDLVCFRSDRDSVVEQRMVGRVLEELGDEGKSARAEAETLLASTVPGRDPRWKELYVRACELRRAKRLAPLLERWTRFVFNEHRHIPNTWKYTEGLSDAQSGRFFRPGSSLNVLEIDGLYASVRTLIDDPGGMLRNPDVSHDGARILFAWKKSDRGDDFHLYEMDVRNARAVHPAHRRPGHVADYEGDRTCPTATTSSSARRAACRPSTATGSEVSNLLR